MSVQLKDIAAATGVSIKTVSNVVNGNFARVSPQTRARVEAMLMQMHYRPNFAARRLRNARVGVITLAIPDLDNPYFSEISQAIIMAAAAESYTVLVDFTSGDRENEARVVNGLRPHLIDGIILDSQALMAEDIRPMATHIPLVLLGERLFDAPYDHITIDNVAAGEMATRHLLDRGRQRIAAIGIREESVCETPTLRFDGYTNALRAAGKSVTPELLAPGGMWHRADGARAMQSLLALDEPPDAVFCFNDLLAQGALSELHAQGVRVPEDIAIIGVDDIEDDAYCFPTLTSIAPDKQAIGQLAVMTLIARIRGDDSEPPRSLIVPHMLQVRQSTSG